jgi:serine phosphatase RsbU (regulator of sigma subunit)
VNGGRNGGLDIAKLLAAAEDAAPVAAGDVFGEFLAEMLGASAVAFLIADFSGEALVRMGHTGSIAVLAAEIQHRLLPNAFTCEAGQFTVAGWLEPAGNIAGDTFDFSVDRDHLHLSITDAMGHEVDAALLATVLVGALRNARRAGAELGEQARLANVGLAERFPDGEFVTGQIVRVDLRAGTATVVNAGHPLPLRLRDGEVAPVPLKPDFPFATDAQHEYQVQTLPLAPGDRLLFVTDGMLERNADSVDIAALMIESADLHPRETVQHLVRALLEATGSKLQDDATVMCLDWHGGPPRSRTSFSGSNL